MLETVRVALDPTPVQKRLLFVHVDASRSAFNAGLAHVKAMIDAAARVVDAVPGGYDTVYDRRDGNGSYVGVVGEIRPA